MLTSINYDLAAAVDDTRMRDAMAADLGELRSMRRGYGWPHAAVSDSALVSESGAEALC